MNGQDHAANFKRLHRRSRMQVAHQIEQPPLTHANGNGSNGNLHETLLADEHLPEKLPVKVAWRDRFRAWGYRVVAKNDPGKYAISQPLALVIVAILGTAFFAYWWRASDVERSQRDEILILKTQLSNEKEKNKEQESRIDQAANWGQSAKGDVKYLQGKFDQFALDYAVKEGRKQE